MKQRQNMIPIYYRLAEDIRSQIESGQIKHGDLLPTEGQLCQEYGISRMTVRQGLSLLAEAGLIETIKGKGTFAAYPSLNQLVIDLKNNQITDGKEFTYRLLEVKLIRGNHHFSRELGCSATKIITVKRLVHKDGEPVAIEEKYLPYQKGKPLLENQMDYADFPEFVAKHQQIAPVFNEMIISVANLSSEQSKLLELEQGMPALLIKQIIYARNNIPIGISVLICHKDRFQLTATSYPFSRKL